MGKEYTIGLDIGTNSVGWAVLQEDLDLVRRKMKVYGNTEKNYLKKNFWGVDLFDEGMTAKDTRLKRTTRRRYFRRRQRISYLQTFFQEEMNRIDPNFFNRLDESFLIEEDKLSERHPIFGTIEEEVAYHKNYATIYHLRKELADAEEKADLRLVYLALAHIIKYRGHFLIEGRLSTENTSTEETFKTFLQKYNQTFNLQEDKSLINPVDETISIGSIFADKVSRAKKAEGVLSLFPDEKRNGTFDQFLKMIVGNQGNFKKTFELEEDAKLQFSKEEYDESLEALLGEIGDEYADVFEAAKNVYNAVELSGILTVTDNSTKAKLSASMIKRYEDHKTDLKLFKEFIRKNLPEKYHEIFNDKNTDGYAGYIDNSKKTSQEKFYKYTTNLIEKIDGAEYFLKKIENEDFLRKQRTFDNGIIPHQIHLEELKAILHHQAMYYPFLQEKFSNFVDLLTFRIPYYVGPLANGNSRFSWLSRKSDEPIRPWNLAEVVDLSKSAELFIERMTNFDLYLPSEKVLPKHSMLYEKYTVYNELTKVTYKDEQGEVQNFSSEEKERIFIDLFKQHRKVTKKDLSNFLRNEYNLDDVIIDGIENKFNASFNTYHDFLKLKIDPKVLDDPANEPMFEEIVKILTIFEDRKMLREQLSKFSDRLSEKTIKDLERRHYTGWGRLSAKLINGIHDKQSNKTILDYLINDDAPKKNINRNFMQLINDNRLTFKEEIEKEQLKANSEESLIEIVQNLAGSPAIKKGIFQSLKIVDELVEIMGYAPTNIVVEMARENQTTANGRRNSRPRLKNLEKAMDDLGGKTLKEHPVDNKALQKDRLYLYYLQNGKDMYTNEELDIHKLSTYDIDHIIPQSFIVDNSLDNRVLVSLSKNRGKLDNVPSKEVVKKMRALWESLYRSGLISKKKFDNLVKAESGGLSEDDKAGFIHRQLVETRQITKNVARILHQRFNSEKDDEGNLIRKVRIITLKSALTSQFRESFGIYKVRDINDYHHAHDAYLNGVVATALLKIYPQLEPEFVYGEFHRFNAFKENRATAKKHLYSNLMNFSKPLKDEVKTNWEQKYIGKVKKVMNYRQMNIVKKVEIQKGGFSKESILPKGDSDKLISRKKEWDTTKYGGFDSPNVAYSVVIRYEKGKTRKLVKTIVGITIMERAAFEKNEREFLKNKGYQNPQICMKLPKYSLYEFDDGRRRLLASAKEAQKGNQMVLPAHLVTLLYHAKHCNEKPDSLKYVTEHQSGFSEIMVHVKDFAEKYTLVDKNLEKILSLYAKNMDSEVKEIAQSFVDLMQLNAFGAPADFKFFGETIPRKRYTSVNELLEATIINQSITGLYETRRRLGD
ncbi:type II CRISPR RNA-guided endonuclease Cas9 [Enterococcus songbeiensis]|uniref:type II CRISPR RNA-guided endonuclease Cas9 n=1 Tax=Enterococcus songbeiensis TaxID=2559927 RepID=UPI0010F60F14|nr:type II CRISPR RNA-guided endonuclease Cas9 [Enterococcus songbeiensis]